MHHSGHQMTSIPVTISMLPPPLGITSKPEHVGCCVYYFNDGVQDCIDYRILVSMAKCTDKLCAVGGIHNRTDKVVIRAIMEGQCTNIRTANRAKQTLK